MLFFCLSRKRKENVKKKWNVSDGRDDISCLMNQQSLYILTGQQRVGSLTVALCLLVFFWTID